MSRVVVIGGGAAGMMAAISASSLGQEVYLYEKNEKLGKKIYITGKGRCNLTNACDMEELFEGILTDYRFLYSAFYGFSNHQTMSFFEENGVPLKIERGNRVFPLSDRSSDVIAALKNRIKKNGVKVFLNTKVEELLYSDKDGKKVVKGVKLSNGQEVFATACIVATGGLSYPITGSTGDGYKFAKEVGHKVTKLIPGLVPMETKEDYVLDLQGLSLRNVNVKIFDNKQLLYEEFGEMLFTHFGVSGPIVLSASSVVGKKLQDKNLKMVIDLKPSLDYQQLDKRVLRDFNSSTNRQFKNAIGNLFPAKLIPVIVELSGINPTKPINAITKEERQRFVELIKGFPLTITKLRPFKEAIITKGGVATNELNPATMESKLVSGLYFAGEVVDLDAVTGGFNLQIAWSSGYLAGGSIK